MKIVFGVAGWEVEKVKDVAVAEDSGEVLGLGDREFGIGEEGALEDAAVDLAMVLDRPEVIEFTGAVAFAGGELEIKQPLFLGFAA